MLLNFTGGGEEGVTVGGGAEKSNKIFPLACLRKLPNEGQVTQDNFGGCLISILFHDLHTTALSELSLTSRPLCLPDICKWFQPSQAG